MQRKYKAFHSNEPQTLHDYCKSAQTYLSEELLPTYWKKNYLQIHGTATGTKVAVAFPNIFMAKMGTEILIQSALKPFV